MNFSAKLTARRFLHRLLCLALRARSRPLEVNQPGRALVIAPHPDDETFGCAGYILSRRLAGLPVDVLFVTDGSASHPQHPRLDAKAIGAARHKEAVQAMQMLQVDSHALHFLDVADGTLAHLSASAAEEVSVRLEEKMRAIQTQEILLPWRRDGSSEHEATFHFVQRALERAEIGARVLEYPVWARWSPQRLVQPLLRSRAVWRLDFRGREKEKQRAIASYASQIEPTPPWTHPMLPAGFAQFFFGAEEFFFET